jgi:hypothetical protein
MHDGGNRENCVPGRSVHRTSQVSAQFCYKHKNALKINFVNLKNEVSYVM